MYSKLVLMVSVQFEEQDCVAVKVAQPVTSRTLSAQVDAEQNATKATAIKNLRIRMSPYFLRDHPIHVGVTRKSRSADSNEGKDPDFQRKSASERMLCQDEYSQTNIRRLSAREEGGSRMEGGGRLGPAPLNRRMRLHIRPQDGVNARLVPTLLPEPGQQVRVQPHGHNRFSGWPYHLGVFPELFVCGTHAGIGRNAAAYLGIAHVA
jgi:hypothetical protein